MARGGKRTKAVIKKSAAVKKTPIATPKPAPIPTPTPTPVAQQTPASQNDPLAQYRILNADSLGFFNKLAGDAPLQSLKIGDATVVKGADLEQLLGGYSAVDSDKLDFYKKLDGFGALKSVGSFGGKEFYNKADLDGVMSKYQMVKPEALGSDPISEALRKNAVQLGDNLVIRSDVGGYYQKLAAEVNDSKISYYGFKSAADMPKDVKLASMRSSNPTANLIVDGKAMRYVPYEAAARIWGDSQGGLSGISDMMGNEYLMKQPVVRLGDDLVKQMNFKDFVGSQYNFETPGLGYLMPDSELFKVFDQIGTGNDVNGYDNFENKFITENKFKGAWLQRLTPEMKKKLNSLPDMSQGTRKSNNASEWFAMGPTDFSGSKNYAEWITLDTDKKNPTIWGNNWWYKSGDGGFFGSLNKIMGVVAPILSFTPYAAIGAAWTLGSGIGSGDIGKIFSGAVGLNIGGIGDFTGSLGGNLGSALGIGDTAGKMLSSGLISGTLSELSGGDFLKGALTGAAVQGSADWAGEFFTSLKSAMPDSWKDSLSKYVSSTNPFETNYENSFDTGAMKDAITPSFWDSLISNATYKFTTEDGLKNLVKSVGMDAAKQYIFNGKVDLKQLGINAVSNVFGDTFAKAAKDANLLGDSALGNAGEVAIGGAVGGAVGSGLSGGDVGQGAIGGAVMSGGTKLVSDWLNSSQWLKDNNLSNATVKDGVLGAFKGGTWAALTDRDISDGLLAGAAGGLLSGYLKDSKTTDAEMAAVLGQTATGLIKKGLQDAPTPVPTPGGNANNQGNSKSWKFNSIGFSSVLPQFQRTQRTTSWGSNRLGG